MNMWDQIHRLQGRQMATLDRRMPFSVGRVENDSVELIIHGTSKERRIPRRELESAWQDLERRRSLTRAEIRERGHSEANPTYVIAILSELPGVTYRQRSLQLHLQSNDA